MSEDKDKLRAQFLAMQTFSDVANLLQITDNQLNYYLYLLNPKYTDFKVPKKSKGTRTLSAPHPRFKLLQSSLNEVLQVVYQARPAVHGFVQGKSIISNANAHRKKRFVLNVDLKDFFPSIHFGRVRGMFMGQPYNLPDKVATILTRICCRYEGLPQGAPTSPTISNMICAKMDSQLRQLALKHHCFYTRYADDITFSTSVPSFPQALAEYYDGKLKIGQELENTIDSNGFKINEQKLRLRTQNQRQEVTGLTVNRFTNVDRNYIRQIRVMLNDWKLKGPDEAYKRHLSIHPKYVSPDKKTKPTFEQIVRGKIEFIGMVRGEEDPLYHSYLAKLANCDPEFAATYIPPSAPQIFLNYARRKNNEDEAKVEQIFELLKAWGYIPWMDRGKITGGDDWENKIFSAIDKSVLFIACLSKYSINKKTGFVQKEIDYALRLQNDEKKNNFIIPLLLENCTPQDTLNKYDWIRYYDKGGSLKLRETLTEKIQNSKPK